MLFLPLIVMFGVIFDLLNEMRRDWSPNIIKLCWERPGLALLMVLCAYMELMLMVLNIPFNNNIHPIFGLLWCSLLCGTISEVVRCFKRSNAQLMIDFPGTLLACVYAFLSTLHIMLLYTETI